jgi:hypothetical protein
VAATLAELGFAHCGNAALVDHFAGAFAVGEAENDFMAGFPFRTRFQDRSVQFHPITADEIFAFAALQFELAVGLQRERGSGARDGFPGYPCFRADVLASDIIALGGAVGSTGQEKQTRDSDDQDFSWEPL